MVEQYSRHIVFESVPNFRDIGGYRARDGYTITWRRLFRSAELGKMTDSDFKRLREEIRLNSVLDLRSKPEIERQGLGLLSKADIRYHNVPFITGTTREEDEKLFQKLTNMGEFYIHLIRQKTFGKCIKEALEVIAVPENHPLVFHCAIGKDRYPGGDSSGCPGRHR
jgi:protein-tyrosine phosphatase